LKVKNELLGVLNLSRLGQDASPFTKGSVELASVLAGQAAIAIKNARLFEEIQQAYQELKKLDELKSEFISVAAHELRTPLAVLLGYATLLEEQVSDESRKYTQAIIHSALHLKKLVADMLNLRYLETGEMELELEELHPLEIVRAVVGELGFLAEEKGQQLVVEVPGDLPMVRADRQKLQLVLSNLVSNAIKFTHDGGAIRIEASMSNDLLTVAVKDPGIGIGNEEHERIFDRFYQVEDSLTRQHDGLGLGLSIARGLVELHQGHLWVESSEGQGSTFYFTVSRRL
jgi:signal transduction histidine kinase